MDHTVLVELIDELYEVAQDNCMCIVGEMLDSEPPTNPKDKLLSVIAYLKETI